MFSAQHLLPARRLLAATLSVVALGMVSPAWASQSDDDDATGDKKDVRVYRMGDDDDRDQGTWTDKNDRDQDGDRDKDGDRDDAADGAKDYPYKYKVEGADVKGGYLGVRVQNITRSLMKARDLPNDEGAMVNRVEDQSPADQAGIERGDIIVEVNRQTIKNSQDLIETMQDIKPGSKINVTVLRDGTQKDLKVEVAKRPRDMAMTAPGFRWRGDSGMDPEQMKAFRGKMHDMDPETMKEMRMMMPGPEFRQQLDDLRKEVESLKDELRDLKEELKDSRDNPRGGRPGR
jgi:membrane-associated protease RseP (regulator of RpoE activity)